MLAAARVKAPAATLVEGDVKALPFPDDSFDLSLAVTVLCFVEDPPRAVAELVPVTRPGGRVVLAELGRHRLWAARRRVKGWRGSASWTNARFYAPRDLGAVLQEAGPRELHTASAA